MFLAVRSKHICSPLGDEGYLTETKDQELPGRWIPILCWLESSTVLNIHHSLKISSEGKGLLLG